MLKSNQIKIKLNDGKPVLGTWNTLGSPLVTEVLSQAGLDFQIIDLEHGPFIIDQIHLHVSACEGSSCCIPLVRIPANDDWMALQALDQGAYGVVMPHINSIESARHVVDITKYAPVGKRGFTPFSKGGGFTNQDPSFHVTKSNSETLIVLIIESLSGLESLDDILMVDHIDVIYFGAYDLSKELGYPGNTKHSSVVNVIQDGVEKVNYAGKHAGGFVPRSQDDIKWLLDMGMRFITYEVDSSILHGHVRNITDWFQGNVR